jgi:hypothetical protein
VCVCVCVSALTCSMRGTTPTVDTVTRLQLSWKRYLRYVMLCYVKLWYVLFVLCCVMLCFIRVVLMFFLPRDVRVRYVCYVVLSARGTFVSAV